jgi:hypothetical protein
MRAARCYVLVLYGASAAGPWRPWSAAWPAHAALGFVVLLWPILYALVYLA